MGTAYNWAGDAIVMDTIMVDKRVVIGNSGVFIPTDIRDWLSCTGSEVITNALQEIGLPQRGRPALLISEPGESGIMSQNLCNI